MNEGLGLNFEYTAPNTPQRNGRDERKFRTLFDKARAMLNTAGFPLEMRQKFWAGFDCNKIGKYDGAQNR